MSLRDLFVEAAGGQMAPSEDLEAAIARIHADGSAAHPEVAVSPEALARHLGRCLAAAADPPAAVAEARAAEIYLACGCSLGDGRALSIVEAEHMAGARKAVMCLDAPQATRDEALQQLRAKLFVPSGGALPHIAQYAGRGSLAGWLRVGAVRIGLNSLRQSRRRDAREDDWAGDAALPVDDPELDYLKQRYQKELEIAMTRAFEHLADDQRELLRLYVSEGLTLDELARLHDVNASTVSRWLARIRDKLKSDARRHFADACALDASECDSLVALVQSRMHISVERLLAS